MQQTELPHTSIRGVSWNRKGHKWEARVQVNGQRKYLGQERSLSKATNKITKYLRGQL